jgi:glycosyltransferase involved in cell wall biosynthesis
VSTDIPGVADYAEQGVTALLVPPGDADSMADAVERVIRDHELRHALATAGHARIAEHFSWDRAVDRLEGLLVSVAGDNAAAGG